MRKEYKVPTTEQRIFKTGEVMKMLNVSRDVLYSLINRGKLRAKRFTPGGHRRFHIDEIRRFEQTMVSKKG